MAEPTMLRRSPLAGMAGKLAEEPAAGSRGVSVSELRPAAMVSLRVTPDSDAARALADVLGAPLPGSVGDVADQGPHHTIWQGSDEWLVVSRTPAEELVPALVARLGGAHAAVVDLSANRTVLEVTGEAARAVLEKGCPLDLHPRAFGPGMAVSTTLARVPLVLWQLAQDSYRLLPRASFADYVARWLLDAAQEFATGSPSDGGF